MIMNGRMEFQPGNNLSFSRSDRERLLNQRSRVIWLSGLSGSGKTTIACNIELELNKQGYISCLLDYVLPAIRPKQQ